MFLVMSANLSAKLLLTQSVKSKVLTTSVTNFIRLPQDNTCYHVTAEQEGAGRNVEPAGSKKSDTR